MIADRDVETKYSMPEFIAELRRLADALESGEPFAIEIEGEEIAIPQNASFTVEHEREDGRQELEFQISWKDEADKDEEDEEQDDEEQEVRA